MTDPSQGERMTQFGGVSSGSDRVAENFWHSNISPPLAPCNGCHFGFSQQAQSWTEMLALICLTHTGGDGIRASE